MKDIAFFMALFIQNRAVWQARRLNAKAVLKNLCGRVDKRRPSVYNTNKFAYANLEGPATPADIF